MNDLESALHYSLRKEVAAHEKIDGERYEALKDYINVLTKVTKSLLFQSFLLINDKAGNRVLYALCRCRP